MSKQTNLLNLDMLMPTRKKVLVLGVEYEVQDVTTGLFLQSEKMRKDGLLNNLEGNDNTANLQIMMQMVKLFVPDMPDEVLNKLNLQQLRALSEFINTVSTEENDNAVPKNVKAKAKAQAKK